MSPTETQNTPGGLHSKLAQARVMHNTCTQRDATRHCNTAGVLSHNTTHILANGLGQLPKYSARLPT